MTQHDQNQDAQLDDLFAVAKRDAPQPSDAFMLSLFDTIPEQGAVTCQIEDDVTLGWWAGVRQAIADTFATRDIFADASALTGVIAAGVFGVWIGVNGGDIGGISLNPFEAQGFDIVDPFSGLDLSYLDGGA